MFAWIDVGIDLHQITINGVGLPIWVFGLMFVIGLLIAALKLCVKYFVKPWAEEKFSNLAKVADMSENINKIVINHPDVIKKLGEVKHAVTNMENVVSGFGVRLALIEEKHDVFEERTKERLTILETKMELKK